MILETQPPTPELLGLSSESTEIEVLTEFIDPPQASIVEHPVKNSSLPDDDIRWGTMRLGHGKAFDLEEPRNSRSRVTVRRQYVTAQGRNILVEGVPMQRIKTYLANLPLQASAATRLPMLASKTLALPKTPLAQAETKPMELASVSPSNKGFVLDYVELDSETSDFTFLADTTYYISSYIYLGGTTTIEGGTVIKYAVGACIDQNYGEIICPNNADQPAVLTAVDDDTVGETISGSTGSPSGFYAYAAIAMDNYSSNPIENLRISYASWGLVPNGDSIPIRNCQFVNTDVAIIYPNGGLVLENDLFYNVGTVFSGGWNGSFNATFLTVHNVNTLLDSAPNLNVTNSLFVGVTNWGGSFDGAFNAANADDTGVFATAGWSSHYLAANSPYRDVGTTDINPDLLAAIQTMTTYAPQDGGYLDNDGMPDLGYHYPVNYPTSADSDSDGLPDWWELYWFGNLTHTGSELDANGNTLLQDYQSYLAGATVDPNPIVFNISVANNYVSTSSPVLQLNVTAGTPYYYTVQVDNTNFLAATNWTAYTSSSITANLGANEGWHELWIGLKGLPAAAQQTWQWKRLKLDMTPPTLVITGPTNGTVTQPMIQLTGYSPEALGSYSYDLSNAVTVVTNQQVLVLDQYHDSTTWELTTNTFQAFDIPLTNGVNTITLHATDLAGNATTLVTNFTLDYSGKTAPVVQMTWPQDGMKISGSTVTVRGQVDDPTVTVTATVTSGDTTTVSGLVERNGRFWVENLPLNSENNTVSITMSNVINQSTVTTLNLVQSALTLTMNPILDDSQLWQPTVSVHGTVSDSTYPVWVNGMVATVTPDAGDPGGTWSADNVPTTPGGVAIFDVTAYPSGEAPSESLSGSGVNPQTANAVNTGTNYDKPAELYVASYTMTESDKEHYHYQVCNPDTGNWVNDVFTNRSQVIWTNGLPGEEHIRRHIEETSNPPWRTMYTNDDLYNIYWPKSSCPNLFVSQWEWLQSFGPVVDWFVYWTDYNFSMSAPVIWEHCNLTINNAWTYSWTGFFADPDSDADINNTLTGQRTADAVIRLRTGGKGLSTRQNLFCLHATATRYVDNGISPPWVPNTETVPIPSTSITVNGQTLGSDGNRWTTLPDNLDIDVTPRVKNVDYYSFTEDQQKYKLHIVVNGTTPLQEDRIVVGAYYCVGQKLSFEAVFSPSGPDLSYVSPAWNYTADYVNNHWTDENGCEEYNIAPIPAMSNPTVAWFYNKQTQDVTANLGLYCKFNNGQSAYLVRQGKFNVYRPSIDHWVLFNYGQPQVMIGSGCLEAGNYLNNSNGMSFQAYIRSTYSGKSGFIQLISGKFTNDISTTLDGYELDGHGGQWVRGQQTVYTNVLNPTLFDDQPHESLPIFSNTCGMSLAFEAYLSFRPNAGNVNDNIFVTLQQVTWGVNASATYTSGAGWQVENGSSITGPNNTDSNVFPFWTETFNP